MSIARTLKNWRQYRRTLNELSQLSSRELQDMGINRSDIDAVARGRGRS
jgi:uncharacterized protein YjiS (DUF1127 family)